MIFYIAAFLFSGMYIREYYPDYLLDFLRLFIFLFLYKIKLYYFTSYRY